VCSGTGAPIVRQNNTTACNVIHCAVFARPKLGIGRHAWDIFRAAIASLFLTRKREGLFFTHAVLAKGCPAVGCYDLCRSEKSRQFSAAPQKVHSGCACPSMGFGPVARRWPSPVVWGRGCIIGGRRRCVIHRSEVLGSGNGWKLPTSSVCERLRPV